MKSIIVVACTFLIAFLTSLLLDVDLVSRNWVRYSLVVLLVVCELAAGFMVLKGLFISKKE